MGRKLSHRVAFRAVIATTFAATLLGPSLANGSEPHPAWIDPSGAPFFGNIIGQALAPDLSGLWAGDLDGAELTKVVDSVEVARATEDARIVVVESGRGANQAPLILVSGTNRTQLLAGATVDIALDQDGESVYAWPVGDDGSLRWLTRIPLDGSERQRVLPPTSLGGVIAVSPDERSVAAAPRTAQAPQRILARFGARPVRALFRGWPLGFDTSGRLIAWNLKGVVRYSPRSGKSVPIAGLGRAGRDATVTPDGRWLIYSPTRSGITILDLADGDRWVLPVSQADGWAVTDLRPGGLLVLEQTAFDGQQAVVDQHAVVDPVSRWIAYVPWTRASP